MIGRHGALAPLAGLLLAGCAAEISHEIATTPGAPLLRIKAAEANVEVIAEPRRDTAVEVAPASGLGVSRQGQTVLISGGDDAGARRKGRCGASGPRVVVRAPPTVQIIAHGGISGRIGPTEDLRLSNHGCGSWQVADVQGPAAVIQAGPGSIVLGRARALTAEVQGEGRVRAAEVAGPLVGSVQGPGRIVVDGGVSPMARLRLKGSGEIVHNGQIGSLDAELNGSGRIHAALVTGQVRKTEGGAGKISWGRRADRNYCAGAACAR